VPSLGTDSVASAAQAHAAQRRPVAAGPAEKPETSFDEMLESALPDRSMPERPVPERAVRDPSAPPPTAPERAGEPDPTAPVERATVAVVRSGSEASDQPKSEPGAEATDGDASTDSAATEPDILLAVLVPNVTASAPVVVPVTVALVPETIPAAEGSAIADVLQPSANPLPLPVGDPAFTPAPQASPAIPAVTTPAAAENGAAPEVEAVEALANVTLPLRAAEPKDPAVPAEPETTDGPTATDQKEAFPGDARMAKKAPSDLPTESDTPADQPTAAKDEKPVQAAGKPAHDRPAPETEARAEPETKPDKVANPHVRQADSGPANSTPGPAPSDAAQSATPAAGGTPPDPVQPLNLTPASATVVPSGHAATAPTANAATAATAYAPAVAVPGLAVEIVARAREGNNRFEIRLDPPELGRIDVHLKMDRDSNVTSRLYVERSETLDLLRRDAPQLERALNQAGLKTSGDGMEFSLRDQGFRDPAPRQEPAANRLVIADEAAPATAAASTFYGRRLGLGGGLDIRV
jgi:flagellar hook-length control protein FliK